MTKSNHESTTSELLYSLIEHREDTESMTVNEVIDRLQDRGFGILMFLFSFPMAIPLPYPPGFTTILGLPLLFFAIQMILGMEHPWLPKWLGRREIKIKHLKIAINSTSSIFRKLERFMKPRLNFFSSLAGEKLIGIVSLFCAISIALPIWFGNAIPSAGIMLMSIGFLYLDGIMIIIGMITSIIGLFVASMVVVFGVKAFSLMLDKLYLLIF